MAKKKSSVRQCRTRNEFMKAAKKQGAEIVEGSNHTRIKTPKGASCLSRGTKEYSKGLTSSIIKQLLAIGLTSFLGIMWIWALSHPEYVQTIMATH